MGLKSLFIICPVSIIIIFLAISIKKDGKKEKDYHNKYITEKIMENKFFGKIKIIEDFSKKILVIKNIQISFGKDKPEVKIQNYIKENNNIYFNSLEHIYIEQEEIIKKLIAVFLSQSDEQIEKFKVMSISTNNKKTLIEYNNQIIRNDEFKIFVNNSLDEDIFFEITSDIGYDELYGIAYINCRTKEKFYLLDNEF